MPISKIIYLPTDFDISARNLAKTLYYPSLVTLAKPAKVTYNLPPLQLTPRLKFQIYHADLYIDLVDLRCRIEQCLGPESTTVLEENEIIWIYFSNPIPYDKNCVSLITTHFENRLQQNRDKWLPKFKESFRNFTNKSNYELTIFSADDSDVFTIGHQKSKFSEVNFPFTKQGYLNLRRYLTLPGKECLLDIVKSDLVLYNKYLDIQNRLRYFGIYLHFGPDQYHLIDPDSTASIFNCHYESNHALPKLRTLIAPLIAPRRELWQGIYLSELSSHANLINRTTTYFTDISLQLEVPSSKRSFPYTPSGYEEFLTYLDWIKQS